MNLRAVCQPGDVVAVESPTWLTTSRWSEGKKAALDILAEVLAEPGCHLGFRHRVWCEARHQPYVSLREDGGHAQVELDLSRGPCQLTEEACLRLRDAISGVVGTKGLPEGGDITLRFNTVAFTSSTLTRWQVQVPVVHGVRVAALFFETATSCMQEL